MTDCPDWWPDWAGQSCIIVASGPSAKDIQIESAKGHAKFIAVNNSWQLAPWSDVLYACDHEWWRSANGCAEFPGLKLTIDKRALEGNDWGVKLVRCVKKNDNAILHRSNTVGWGGNSGFHALQLAVQFGCSKIILVGFDMTISGGVHWHGPHPKGMHNPTPGIAERWRRAVDNAWHAIQPTGTVVINCSLVSALRNYPKMTFEEALAL